MSFENKKEFIVFLDDEQNVLNSIQRVLRNEEYAVYTTGSFKEAIDFIEHHEVKVVVSDYKMPDVSGIDFLEEVRKKFPMIVRVLFTGFLDQKQAQEVISKFGIYCFIDKPWDEESLKKALREAFDKYNNK